MATSHSSAPPDDVYIVSDLHLSLGKPQGASTWSRLESFFYDDVFERFIAHLLEEQERRDRDATFILGGDVFDFLVITDVPSRSEALEQGIVVSRDMRRVGLGSSARHAATNFLVISGRAASIFLRAAAGSLLYTSSSPTSRTKSMARVSRSARG